MPATIPFVSTQLVRLDDGDFLEVYPWPIYGKNFAQMTFWGNQLAADAVVELISEMVIRRELQLAVAFHFHFDATRFNEDGDVMVDVRRKFWSAWDPLVTSTMQSAIDANLRSLDSTYALFCEFCESPRDPKFRGLLNAALTHCDLSLGYELAAD